MFGREKKNAIDVGQIASSALDAFMGAEKNQPSPNGGHPTRADESRHRLGTAAAVALGLAAVTAGRAVYSRAKGIDLEQVAERVEDRLNG